MDTVKSVESGCGIGVKCESYCDPSGWVEAEGRRASEGLYHGVWY